MTRVCPYPKGTSNLAEKTKSLPIPAKEQKALWDDGTLSCDGKGGAIHSLTGFMSVTGDAESNRYYRGQKLS